VNPIVDVYTKTRNHQKTLLKPSKKTKNNSLLKTKRILNTKILPKGSRV